MPVERSLTPSDNAGGDGREGADGCPTRSAGDPALATGTVTGLAARRTLISYHPDEEESEPS